MLVADDGAHGGHYDHDDQCDSDNNGECGDDAVAESSDVDDENGDVGDSSCVAGYGILVSGGFGMISVPRKQQVHTQMKDNV